MKVEKIDIKRESIDIPEGNRIVKFAKHPPIEAHIIHDEAQYVNQAIDNIEVFEVREIKPFGEPVRRYLVKTDENQLFQDLIQIRDELIKEFLDRRSERDHHYFEANLQRQRVAIKNLPWWRRLINDF